jgi:hypothetical protein
MLLDGIISADAILAVFFVATLIFRIVSSFWIPGTVSPNF